MKKLFLIALLFSCIRVYAQEKKVALNEISINPVSIFLKTTHITYERLFKNSVHSVGIDLGIYLGKKTDEGRPNYLNLDLYNEQIIRPFYRLYFNENSKYFFIETHLNFDKFYSYLKPSGPFGVRYYYEEYRKVGGGFNLGYKLLSNNNFSFEIKGGVTKDFSNQHLYESEYYEFDEYPFTESSILTLRLTIGKRF